MKKTGKRRRPQRHPAPRRQAQAQAKRQIGADLAHR